MTHIQQPSQSQGREEPVDFEKRLNLELSERIEELSKIESPTLTEVKELQLRAEQLLLLEQTPSSVIDSVCANFFLLQNQDDPLRQFPLYCSLLRAGSERGIAIVHEAMNDDSYVMRQELAAKAFAKTGVKTELVINFIAGQICPSSLGLPELLEQNEEAGELAMHLLRTSLKHSHELLPEILQGREEFSDELLDLLHEEKREWNKTNLVRALRSHPKAVRPLIELYEDLVLTELGDEPSAPTIRLELLTEIVRSLSGQAEALPLFIRYYKESAPMQSLAKEIALSSASIPDAEDFLRKLITLGSLKIKDIPAETVRSCPSIRHMLYYELDKATIEKSALAIFSFRALGKLDEEAPILLSYMKKFYQEKNGANLEELMCALQEQPGLLEEFVSENKGVLRFLERDRSVPFYLQALSRVPSAKKHLESLKNSPQINHRELAINALGADDSSVLLESFHQETHRTIGRHLADIELLGIKLVQTAGEKAIPLDEVMASITEFNY